MWKEEPHISDQEILQAVDGELSKRRSERVQKHLAACWSCRARRSEIERTITEFVQARDGAEVDLPPIEGPKRLLQTSLAELAAATVPRPFVRHWWRMRESLFGGRGAAVIGMAFCAVVLFGLVMFFSLREVEADSTPDAHLTPGATRSVTRDDICSWRKTEAFYPIPSTLAYRVFEKYGIRNPRPRTYEVDYLITPKLGGAEDIRNLWPQPYSAGIWNAHVKDALENYLYESVCEGTVDLAVAQHDISANWIDAYKKYFQTNVPLTQHASFSVDPPWGE